MLPRIRHVESVGQYRLTLTFTDGVVGEVDLRGQIVGRGGVFAPLEDEGYFRRVTVDAECGTIVWPNGLDLDPDVLYAAVIANRRDAVEVGKLSTV